METLTTVCFWERQTSSLDQYHSFLLFTVILYLDMRSLFLFRICCCFFFVLFVDASFSILLYHFKVLFDLQNCVLLLLQFLRFDLCHMLN